MLIHDIALTLLPRVGPNTAATLVSLFDGAEGALRTTYEGLIGAGVAPGLARTLRECPDWARAQSIIDLCATRGIRMLVKGSDQYPSLLNECNDAPHILYVNGGVDFNVGKWLAVVGTRKASGYGVDVVNSLVRDVASEWSDSVIVSGLAYGIDKAAHIAAMDNGLATIAVMAGWVEDIVPPAHHYIARRILDNGGAIVSDMPPGTIIRGGNFISRNRIIAGLSHLTFVAESASKGGSLITADIAHSYSRALFAVGGRNSDELCAGTNALIKNNKAIMYQSLSDIADEMAWGRTSTEGKVAQAQDNLPDYMAPVLNMMEEGAGYTLDELAERAELPLADTSSILIGLELRGLIRTMQGGIYQKRRY